MKIAVTGANGFIGRHVLAELAKHPVEITSIVRRLSTSPPESTSIKIIELDIHHSPANAYELLGHPDALIHLAWSGLPNYRSLHHFEQELQKQYQFLRRLVMSGLRTLVVAGTCLEYGMQSGVLNEDMAAHPNTPYGFAKDVLRQQLEYLQQTHSFSLTWARLFYVYGEGQSGNSLLPQLRSAVDQGEKVFNMSGGKQLRDYLHVSEVAKSLVSLAISGENIGIINICSGTPISVQTLVEKWIKDNNWEINLNLGHYPYPDYEPMEFWGDRRKLDSYLKPAK